MSTLHPKHDVGIGVGILTGMYGVAGAFAGVLACGLLRVKSDSLHGWQVPFHVEGGIKVFFSLPKSFSKAWFLSRKERQYAVQRMELDLTGTQDD
jgi:hypothetical protein